MRRMFSSALSKARSGQPHGNGPMSVIFFLVFPIYLIFFFSRVEDMFKACLLMTAKTDGKYAVPASDALEGTATAEAHGNDAMRRAFLPALPLSRRRAAATSVLVG